MRPTPTKLTTSNMVRTWQDDNNKMEQFVSEILSSRVQIQLNQPFSKDSLNHSFYAAKSFDHILSPLLKSGFLSCRATKALEKAPYRVRQLQRLRKNTLLSTPEVSEGTKPIGKKQAPFAPTGKQ